MKYLVCCILLTIYLPAAELVLNRYKENGQQVDIYHLVDEKPVSCHVDITENFRKRIVCRLSGEISLEHPKREERYFTIYFKAREVVFEAKAYARVLPTDTGLIDKDVILPPGKYRHWTIVGSRHRPEIFAKDRKKIFNFPVAYQEKSAPFIGALDLNGEPAKNKKGAIYLSKIKKLYRLKKYKQVIKEAEAYVEKAADIFNAEIGLYKLRALSHMAKEERENYNLLLEEARDWIEAYPSNSHIPEVYMFIVQSYLGRGRLKQGEKYLRLLKSGFGKNLYTQRAQIIYADTLYKSKKRRGEAMRIYKKVLFDTKDLETASHAAMRIASGYLDLLEPEKAEKYIDKVIKGNPGFIKTHPVESFAIAKRFAEQEHYKTALKIVANIAVKEKKQAEEILKEKAYWLESEGEKEAAIAAYNRYLKTFRNGRFTDFARKHLDGLMLTQDDENLSQKLQFAETLLKRYSDREIVKRALEEKVKILYKMGRYRDILSLEKQLKREGLEAWIGKSAKRLLQQSLENGACDDAVKLSETYQLQLEARYDEAMFRCDLKSGKYEEAKRLIDKHIGSEDLHEKLKWLYHAVHYYQKRDENKKVILTGNDVLKLAHNLGTKKYDDVLYDIVDAYYNLREYDDMMLRYVKDIEKRFPDDIRNIDLFMKVVRYARKRKDDLMAINYAKKVIELQKKANVKVYSPDIEILYAHMLRKVGKYREALQVVLDLLTYKLTDVQKAEVLYLAGELSLKLGKKDAAKEFYTKCGVIVKESAWQKLCAENLQILSD